MMVTSREKIYLELYFKKKCWRRLFLTDLTTAAQTAVSTQMCQNVSGL